jgi:catechol 2,3-dioxygenase
MFDDPEGNHIELSAEMERFYDDRAEYQPRTWAVDPRTVNLWGPVAGLRRTMSGEPSRHFARAKGESPTEETVRRPGETLEQ